MIDSIAKVSSEGGLEKPTRHIVDWKNPDFLNEDKYEEELRRVADACHGCRLSLIHI